MSDTDSSDDDFSDTLSNVSGVSYTDTEFDIGGGSEGPEVVQVDFEEKFLQALDGVSAKRASTRTSALKSFIKGMTKRLCADILEDRTTTATYKLLACMKRSRGADAVLAGQALELLIIILGPNNQAIYEDCAKALFPIVKTGRKIPIRAAAIRAIAMICFTASIERSSTVTCMAILEDIIKGAAGEFISDDEGGDDDGGAPDSPEVKSRKKKKKKDISPILVQALKAWGLLSTTRTDAYLGSDGFKTMAPFLCALLDHDNYDVRCAAGQNAAHLAQHYFARVKAGGDAEEEEEGDLEKRLSKGGIDRVVIALRVRLKEMSIESHRYKSKKELKKQRSFFRALCRTLESGEAPDMKIGLKTEKIVLSTWTDIKRMEAFRASVGSGMNLYLRTCPLLRDVFDLGPVRHDAVEKLSKTEKRMFRSPNSEERKLRTLDRARERRIKAARMGLV
eukprot:g2413.t1